MRGTSSFHVSLLPKAPRPFSFFPFLLGAFSYLVALEASLAFSLMDSPSDRALLHVSISFSTNKSTSTPATCPAAFPRSSAALLAIGPVANDWLRGNRSGRLPSPHTSPISDATDATFLRGHIPGRLAGIGEIGCVKWIPLTLLLTQVPRVSNAWIRKVIGGHLYALMFGLMVRCCLLLITWVMYMHGEQKIENV